MANSKAALKSIRQDLRREAQNKAAKSELKTFIKSFDQTIARKDQEEAKKLFPLLVKKLDKASSKGLLHKNTLSRKKSRLARKLNSTLSR